MSGLQAYKGNVSNALLLPEADSMHSLFDPFKMLSRRNKLECPRFEGYDFLGWLMRVEQFFDAVGTQEIDEVQIVMIHLDGKMLQWHQRYMKMKGLLKDVKWIEYMADMRARFHDTEFQDPMSEIVSLKQSQTVEEYYDEFEGLLNLIQLPDDYALSIFVSNLKPELSKAVRLFHPKSLSHALNLAKQMEFSMYNFPRRPYTAYKSPTPYHSPYPHVQSPNRQQPNISHHPLPGLLPTPKPPYNLYTNTLPKPSYPATTKPTYSRPEPTNPKFTRGPTREERDERKRKGLCMWCGQKFVQGHNCIRSQLYHILIDDTTANEGEPEEFQDCMDSMEEGEHKEDSEVISPTISLHALLGVEGCQTMRIMGKIKNQTLVMLVDSGSTHNFMDQTVARKLKCATRVIAGVPVTIANGDTLKAQKICEGIKWEAQGFSAAH